MLGKGVGRYATFELQLPLAGLIACPFSLSEQISLNDPLIRSGPRCHTTLGLIFCLHSKPPDKRVDQATAEVNPHDRSELPDGICLPGIDTRQFRQTGVQFRNDV